MIGFSAFEFGRFPDSSLDRYRHLPGFGRVEPNGKPLRLISISLAPGSFELEFCT